MKRSRRARSIRPIETVPRSITIAHYDPARDYQTGVQRATRPGAGNRHENVDAPVAIDAGTAKAIATAMLARAEAGRVSRRVSGDVSAIMVGPGDRVTISGEDGQWRVTGAMLEGMVATLDLVAERPVTLPAIASPGRSLGAPDAAAGATIIHAFELPALDEVLLTEPRILVAAAGTGAGWRRAALRYSLDGGAGWAAIGGTAAPATLGETAAVLWRGPVTLMDRRNEVVVELAHEEMSLRDAGASALDLGGNLALIGDELIQFGRAVQLAPRRWRLSELLRGRRGTVAADHGPAERFVLIEQDSVVAISVAASAGRTVRLAADAVADTAETDVLLNGSSILPPAPIRLDARAQADGSASISWRRRGRSGWRWRDGAETPLGEEREQYRVTITPYGLPPRTMTVEPPGAFVTAAERAAGMVTVSVAQIGTNGISPAAILTF